MAEVSKKRRVSLTYLLLFWSLVGFFIVVDSFGAFFVTLNSNSSDFSAWFLFLRGFTGIGICISCTALLYWKKWGVYGLIGSWLTWLFVFAWVEQFSWLAILFGLLVLAGLMAPLIVPLWKNLK